MAKKDLAQKYGIKLNDYQMDEINLDENPYKFEGTFKEFYGLVSEGRIKLLKQGNYNYGISVSGYVTIEADNLAGRAFAQVYTYSQVMKYVEIANGLISLNLIPEVISEDPLRIKVLGDKILDENLNEVEPEVKVNPQTGEVVTADLDDELTFTIDGIVYHIVNNPSTSARDGKYHPMIARLDGEEVPNRKEIARQFLRDYGYTEADFAYPVNTAALEKEVARILGE